MSISLMQRKKKPIPGRIALHMKRYWRLHVMALPGLLYLLVFCYAPMFGVVMAFQNFNVRKGFFCSPFIRFKNFEFLFATTDAWTITRNTVCYNVVFIILNVVLSMSLAILLNELYSKRLAKTLQTMFMMPHFLSMAVASIVVYAFLSQRDGYLSRIMVSLGYPTRNWYTYRPLWPWLLVLVNAWKGVGYSAVVYLASISGISDEYYEAAVLDGATKLQQARYITIPHLRQIMTILLILNIGNIFRGDFGLFYNVTQDNGMLYPVTDVIDTYVYRALTKLNNTGMSTAAGLYQSVVGFILILLSNFIIRRVDPESALF